MLIHFIPRWYLKYLKIEKDLVTSIMQCSEYRPQTSNEPFAPFHRVILHKPDLLLSEITMDYLSWSSCAKKESKLDVKGLENFSFQCLAVCDITVLHCLKNEAVGKLNSLEGPMMEPDFTALLMTVHWPCKHIEGFMASKRWLEQKLATPDPLPITALCVSHYCMRLCAMGERIHWDQV